MLDVLAVAAHPDDIEAGCGGFLVKAKKSGLRTGMIVCTRGEAGGFASMETRIAEAEAGANILQVDYFRLLDFPDAGIEVNQTNLRRLIPLVRECAPRIVLTLHPVDSHPDHEAVAQLVDNVTFVAGLKQYAPDNTTWHPEQVLYFPGDRRTNRKLPDLIVAIDEVWEEKLAAINAHQSQHILGYKDKVIQRSRQYGALGGTMYGEGFYCRQPLALADLSILFDDKGGKL
jgi:bacillithiol biosynthesis deacetylase BshB1